MDQRSNTPMKDASSAMEFNAASKEFRKGGVWSERVSQHRGLKDLNRRPEPEKMTCEN